MRVLTIGRCAVALGIALAVGPVICPVMAEAAAPEFRHEAATTQAAGLGSVVGGVVEARVRVPPGILAGVPSGGDPYAGSRPLVYPLPPAVLVPPVPVAWPPPAAWLPLAYEFAPLDFGPCFVPTEHTSQLGYYGSCLESYFRQYFNRPD